MTIQNAPEDTATPSRPLSIAHLIFGLIFAGIAALWFIGNANDSDIPDQAAGLPVVLIGAGIIGLIAALISRRQSVRRSAANLPVAPDHTGYTEYTDYTEYTETPNAEPTEDTTVLTDQKDES